MFFLLLKSLDLCFASLKVWPAYYSCRSVLCRQPRDFLGHYGCKIGYCTLPTLHIQCLLSCQTCKPVLYRIDDTHTYTHTHIHRQLFVKKCTPSALDVISLSSHLWYKAATETCHCCPFTSFIVIPHPPVLASQFYWIFPSLSVPSQRCWKVTTTTWSPASSSAATASSAAPMTTRWKSGQPLQER